MPGTEDSAFDRLDSAIRLCLEHRAAPRESDEEFLARHESIRDLLGPLLIDDRRDEAGPEGPAQPRFLGDFEILRELGRGGMGVVYEAMQSALGRRVALKVLPPHLTLSAVQIGRFRREAAAAAKLRHPGIVPVYEVGEAEGTHFIAMQLVEGGTLADRMPQRCGPRAAAELLATVGEALQHAHENGVVHRDVKPRNILLDADGNPLLADFGLARENDRETLTATGGISGTPHYMSPEQALGSGRLLDARTDVFSLGVVMYEMLAGELPFDGENSQILLSRLAHRDPRDLRSYDRRIPRDLAVICHEALEKSVADRYASAGDMARDLRRFLAGEPIRARPRPWPVRVGKLVRRRPLAAATAILVLLIAIGAPVGWVWHRRVEHNRIEQAADAVDQVFSVLDATAMHRRRGQDSEYEAQVGKAARAYDALLAYAPSDPALRIRTAVAGYRLAWVYGHLGRTDLALRTYDESIANLRSLVAERPTAERRVALAKALHDRGVHTIESGADAQAIAFFEQARSQWNQLVSETQGELRSETRLDVVLCDSNLGRAFTNLHHLEDAEAALARADVGWKALPRSLREKPDTIRHLARIRIATGWLSLARGRAADSLKEFQSAREQCEPLLASAPHDWFFQAEHAVATKGIGMSLYGQRRIADATRELESAERQFTDLAKSSPRVASHRFELATVKRHLGLCRLAAGEMTRAGEFLEAAVAILTDLDARLPASVRRRLDLAQALNVAGYVRQQSGTDREPALVRYERSRRLLDGLPDIAAVWRQRGALLNNLGTLELRDGNYDVARAYARKAIAAQRRALDGAPDHAGSRAFLVNHYNLLIRAALHERDHAEVVRTARSLASHANRSAVQHGFCAAVAARSIGLVRADDSLDAKRRAALERRYGDVAVAWLRRAVELGHPAAEKIPYGAEFSVLSEREDYRALVDALRKRR